MKEGIILFLSTIAVGSLAFPLAGKVKNAIKLLLSFSGAFLLAICALHILPDVYESHTENVGLFVLLGFLFQIMLEFYSQGTEHGHAHYHGHAKKIPLGIVVSLCIHAFFEGLPFGFHEAAHESYLLGIILHKMPVAFVLTSLLIGHQLKKSITFILLALFALMPALGSLVVGYTDVIADYYPYVMASVLGMMLHISTTILFEVSENHQFNRIKFTSVILGFLSAYLVLHH